MDSLKNSTILLERAGPAGSDLTILDIPTEIQLTILALLDLPSLLAIRQTCKGMCQVTHERLLWLLLLEKQRQYLPVPHDVLHSEDPLLPNHPTSSIESTVRQMQSVADRWARPRDAVSLKIPRKRQNLTLSGVEIFLDRWLLVVYSEGVVHLFDIQPTPTPTINPPNDLEKDNQAAVVLRGCLELMNGIWNSYAISFDSMANKLFFTIVYSLPLFLIHIYEIDLTELSSNNDMAPDAFKIIRIIPLYFSPTIRAMHIKERVVAVSYSNKMALVAWDEDEDPSPEQLSSRQLITTTNPDQKRKNIIAAHFMGPYILIFQPNAIELHDFVSFLRHASSKPPTWPVLKHPLTEQSTLRDISFSDCSYSRNHISETDTYTTTCCAYDVIMGLFVYVVQLTLPFEPSTLPPFVQVTLMGVYPLVSGNIAGVVASLPNPPPEIDKSHYQSHLLRLAAFVPRVIGNRGSVTAYALGSQGMRAVLVARKRSSPVREIQVWSKPLTGDSDSILTEIERKVVYSMSCTGLSDDIHYCTFSEFSGKIVVGTRAGDITILDI